MTNCAIEEKMIGAKLTTLQIEINITVLKRQVGGTRTEYDGFTAWYFQCRFYIYYQVIELIIPGRAELHLQANILQCSNNIIVSLNFSST